MEVEFSEGVQTLQVLHAADVISCQVEKAQPAQVGHVGYPGDLDGTTGDTEQPISIRQPALENTLNKAPKRFGLQRVKDALVIQIKCPLIVLV